VSSATLRSALGCLRRGLGEQAVCLWVIQQLLERVAARSDASQQLPVDTFLVRLESAVGIAAIQGVFDERALDRQTELAQAGFQLASALAEIQVLDLLLRRGFALDCRPTGNGMPDWRVSKGESRFSVEVKRKADPDWSWSMLTYVLRALAALPGGDQVGGHAWQWDVLNGIRDRHVSTCAQLMLQNRAALGRGLQTATRGQIPRTIAESNRGRIVLAWEYDGSACFEYVHAAASSGSQASVRFIATRSDYPEFFQLSGGKAYWVDPPKSSTLKDRLKDLLKGVLKSSQLEVSEPKLHVLVWMVPHPWQPLCHDDVRTALDEVVRAERLPPIAIWLVEGFPGRAENALVVSSSGAHLLGR
jgi:hypothetical protein